MKKVLLFTCTLVICALGFSQMTSKNGHTILPEAGDWAIQTNGINLLNMGLNALDIMNDNGNNAQFPGYVEENEKVIVGKYFNSDDFATRYRIALNSNSYTEKEYGDDPTVDADDDPVDALLRTKTSSYWELKVGYGHEYRRGHNRLQGFYGYEGLIGLNRGEDGSENVSRDWEFSYEDIFEATGDDSFTTSEKQGMGVSLEARTFVGVEYFAAPKVSFGFEFNWGLEIEMSGRSSSETTTASYDEDGDIELDDSETLGDSNRSFKFDVGNMGGAVTATFHF
tara:strand:- start:413 stop:1258 length:846 start_codon:yes stop_codon:yes gene_type:complete